MLVMESSLEEEMRGLEKAEVLVRHRYSTEVSPLNMTFHPTEDSQLSKIRLLHQLIYTMQKIFGGKSPTSKYISLWSR